MPSAMDNPGEGPPSPTIPEHRSVSEEAADRPVSVRQWIGLAMAPVLAVTVYWIIPTESRDAAGSVIAGLSQPGRAVAAVGVLMATLWVTEALPISATALLPIALFPVVTGGGVSIRAATAPYAHELIFLFLGGFLLANAMQRWGLHRRIALRTILLMGVQPGRLVGGFMLASAFWSMWVSNTATVVMMFPIAMSVVELVRRAHRESGSTYESESSRGLKPAARGAPSNFALCLMLGTAYAASVGGVGTLIGTPPNMLLAAFLEEQYGMEITFVRWMAVGVPLVAVFLPLVWLVLTRMVYPIRLASLPDGRELIRTELATQGPTSRAERAVGLVFILTAATWMTRPLLVGLTFPGGHRPLAGLTDAGIAIAAGMILFAIPIYPRQGRFLLTWKAAAKLPWGILLLFGGGLSLAAAVNSTGVADFIARAVSGFQGDSPVMVVALVAATIVFLTELTSNTATTATFLPILAAVGVGLGIDPLLLLLSATIAASCAFMMPVATPPNAIVFASGEITIPQMCKAGIWLNVLAIGLILLLVHFVGLPVLSGARP